MGVDTAKRMVTCEGPPVWAANLDREPRPRTWATMLNGVGPALCGL